jgi:hypothetical protein
MMRKRALTSWFVAALIAASAGGMTLGVRQAQAATRRGCSCTNSGSSAYQCSGTTACVPGSWACSVNCAS